MNQIREDWKFAFFHSETDLENKTKQSELKQLKDHLFPADSDADAFDAFDHSYQQLPEAALRAFANAAYRYWQLHLPTAEAVSAAQQTIQRCRTNCNNNAQGRQIYRYYQKGKSTQYYWAGDAKAQALSMAGIFYLCYPSFELPPLESAAREIKQVSPLIDWNLQDDLLKQEEAEKCLRRWQEGCGYLLQLSDHLQKRLPVAEQLISDYCLTQLFYYLGHIEVILPKEKAHQSAFFYFLRLAGRESLAQWQQIPPLVSTAFSEAVCRLRGDLEHRVWMQKQLLLQSGLFWAKGVDRSALESLPGLIAELNIDEIDDPYRLGVREFLRKFPDKIKELTESVLRTAYLWRLYGHKPLAHAQLKFYSWQLKKLLVNQRKKNEEIQKIGATESYITACEEFKREMKTYLAREDWSSSDWQTRERLFQEWRDHAAKTGLNSLSLVADNTRFAHQIMNHLCREIQRQLGPPPCAFVILGMGSYSREEMGFSSDLDFAFLIEDAVQCRSFYFKAFLDLLVFKAGCFPQNILPLETKELWSIRTGECWIATPKQMIEEHCFLPDSDRGRFCDQARSFPLRWAKPLYIPEQDNGGRLLWTRYQQLLYGFYRQEDDEKKPYYHRTELWCLQHYLKVNDISLVPMDQEAQDKNSLSKRLQKVDLKRELLYPISHTILCYGRAAGLLTMTGTLTMLDQLAKHRVIAPGFIRLLREALRDLYYWRLRRQWVSCQEGQLPPNQLEENEVYLWRTTEIADRLWGEIPYGFYLNALETERLKEIRLLLSMIERSTKFYVQHSFDPLRVTIEDSLSAIKADESAGCGELLDFSHYQNLFVQLEWLSSVMTFCADDLRIPPSDSDCLPVIQQNPQWRSHWWMYWSIPQHWRGFYMGGLKTSPRQPADERWQYLAQAANIAGWRLCKSEQSKYWHGWLSDRFTQFKVKPEQEILVEWIDMKGSRISHYLREIYVKPLFVARKGRQVVPLHEDGSSEILAYATFYPETPDAQAAAMDILSWQISGYGGLTTLCRITHQKKSYPVLISKNLGEKLSVITPELDAQVLNNLDRYSFTLKVIECLLTNSDGSLDHWAYFLGRSFDGRDRYRLAMVNTDELWRTSRKNALYCMNTMNEPLDANGIADFLRLDPELCIEHWLKSLNEITFDGSSLLFNKYLFKAVLDPRMIDQLFEKWLQVRQILLEEKNVRTPMDLLERVRPTLAPHYRKIFRPGLCTLKSRFAALPVLDSRAGEGKPALYTPAQLLSQEWPRIKKIDTVRRQVQNGDLTTWLKPELSSDERQQILRRLDFQTMEIKPQTALLESLAESAKLFNLRALSLVRSDALNDQLLKKIVKKNPQLQLLDITACVGITPVGVSSVLSHGLELEELHLAKLPRLDKLDISLFKSRQSMFKKPIGMKLKLLDLRECPQLTSISDLHFPQLKTLLTYGCPRLTVIGVTGFELATPTSRT